MLQEGFTNDEHVHAVSTQVVFVNAELAFALGLEQVNVWWDLEDSSAHLEAKRLQLFGEIGTWNGVHLAEIVV